MIFYFFNWHLMAGPLLFKLVTMVVQIFINLTFSHNISTSPYSSYSITGFNNQLYIGTDNGTVLVVQYEVILNQFSGCGGNSVWLTFILFDEYGHFATSCNNIKLYLLFAKWN